MAACHVIEYYQSLCRISDQSKKWILLWPCLILELEYQSAELNHNLRKAQVLYRQVVLDSETDICNRCFQSLGLLQGWNYPSCELTWTLEFYLLQTRRAHVTHLTHLEVCKVCWWKIFCCLPECRPKYVGKIQIVNEVVVWKSDYSRCKWDSHHHVDHGPFWEAHGSRIFDCPGSNDQGCSVQLTKILWQQPRQKWTYIILYDMKIILESVTAEDHLYLEKRAIILLLASAILGASNP